MQGRTSNGHGVTVPGIGALRAGITPDADGFVTDLWAARNDAMAGGPTRVPTLLRDALVEAAPAKARLRSLGLHLAELEPMLWGIGHDLRAEIASMLDAGLDLQRWLTSVGDTRYAVRYTAVVEAVRDAIPADGPDDYWAAYYWSGMTREEFAGAQEQHLRVHESADPRAFWASLGKRLTQATFASWRTLELGGTHGGRMTWLDDTGQDATTIRVLVNSGSGRQRLTDVVIDDLVVRRAVSAFIMLGRMVELHPQGSLIAPPAGYTPMRALRDVLLGKREPADAVTTLAKAIDPKSEGMQAAGTEHTVLAEAYASAARKHAARLLTRDPQLHVHRVIVAVDRTTNNE